MRKVEKQLRERNKRQQEMIEKIEADREKYRSFWKGKLKWFIELQGAGKSPSMPWLIEDMARFFNSVDNFYW